MFCDVVDNYFDLKFIHEIYDKITVEVPLTYTNVANRKTVPYGYEGTHRLLGTTIFSRSNMNRVEILHPASQMFFDVFDYISDFIENSVYLSDITINVQYQGCDGTTHTDGSSDEDYSIIVMVNPIWEKSWGGEFQTMKEFDSVLQSYEYIPGRIIFVHGNQPHRALAPKEKYVYRTTIAYRIKVPEGECLTLASD